MRRKNVKPKFKGTESEREIMFPPVDRVFISLVINFYAAAAFVWRWRASRRKRKKKKKEEKKVKFIRLSP